MREMKFHFISPVTGPKEEGNDNGTQNPAYTASRAYTGKRGKQGGKGKPCPMYRGAQKRTRAHGPNKKHQWTSQQLTCPWGFATEEKYLFDVLCGTGWGASGKHNAAPHSRTDTHAHSTHTLKYAQHTKKGQHGRTSLWAKKFVLPFSLSSSVVRCLLDRCCVSRLEPSPKFGTAPWGVRHIIVSFESERTVPSCRQHLSYSQCSFLLFLSTCLCVVRVKCWLVFFFGWLNGPGYHFLCLFLAKRRRAPFGIVSLPREEGAASGEMTVWRRSNACLHNLLISSLIFHTTKPWTGPGPPLLTANGTVPQKWLRRWCADDDDYAHVLMLAVCRRSYVCMYVWVCIIAKMLATKCPSLAFASLQQDAETPVV